MLNTFIVVVGTWRSLTISDENQHIVNDNESQFINANDEGIKQQ